MKVVVICEDLRRDEFILRPIIEQLFRELGINRVRIDFPPRTIVQGVADALKISRLKQVYERYPMADAFFLIVDRDGKSNREQQVEDRVNRAEQAGIQVFGCLAVEEVETWALALHRKELSDDWEKVRSDSDPKETYFEPLVQQKSWQNALGKGRKAAMTDLRKKWDSLKSLCTELQQLVDDVRIWLESRD